MDAMSDYVTNESWLGSSRRPDAIDDVADQFERVEPTGLESFWAAVELRHSAPARMAADPFLRRCIERRAG